MSQSVSLIPHTAVLSVSTPPDRQSQERSCISGAPGSSVLLLHSRSRSLPLRMVCVFVPESWMKWREVSPPLRELTSFFSPFIFLHVQTSVSNKVNPDPIICICDEHMNLKKLQADRGKLHTQSFFVNYTQTHTLYCVSTGLICMQINLRWASTQAELFSHAPLGGMVSHRFRSFTLKNNKTTNKTRAVWWHTPRSYWFLQAHFLAHKSTAAFELKTFTSQYCKCGKLAKPRHCFHPVIHFRWTITCFGMTGLFQCTLGKMTELPPKNGCINTQSKYLSQHAE